MNPTERKAMQSLFNQLAYGIASRPVRMKEGEKPPPPTEEECRREALRVLASSEAYLKVLLPFLRARAVELDEYETKTITLVAPTATAYFKGRADEVNALIAYLELCAAGNADSAPAKEMPCRIP